MISQSVEKESRKIAAKMFEEAGLALTQYEKDKIEIADFGLSHLEIEGAQICTLVATERIGVKVLALFPGQKLPEHWHPRVGNDEGKEETLRILSGELLLYIPEESSLTEENRAENKRKPYTCKREIRLKPGDQHTLLPGTKHWFKAGIEGAVFFSFCTVARDQYDKFSDPNVIRSAVIREDSNPG